MGAGSWTVYAIWTDAYFNWQDKGKHRGSFFCFLILAATSWHRLISYRDFWDGGDWFSYIVEKDGAMFFFQALFFSLLVMIFLAKWFWEKKAETDRDDEQEKF